MVSIVVEGLSKRYAQGAQVFEDLSFGVKPGEILTVVGHSGCGKSTLLNVLAGLTQSTLGSCLVTGSIGYVTQDTLMLPWRTALENVLLPLELRGRLSPQDFSTAKRILGELGIAHACQQYPHQLSGGMRQRLSLARMFLHDAEVLLLDEPFSALDFDIRMQTGARLRQWIRTHRKVAVLVTHNIDEALSLGDQVLVLTGSPAKIALQTEIQLDEQDRQPEIAREHPLIKQLFRNVLHLLSSATATELQTNTGGR